MRKLFYGISILLVSVFLYLFFAPTDVDPIAWQSPPAPSMTGGPYASNHLLAGIERIAGGVGRGPEAIALDAENRIYTGFDDGRVARFAADGSGYTLLARTGGRPLGVVLHADGRIFVCDANRGLLQISSDGAVKVLADRAEGQPFRFTNDLAIASDGGKIYFTDASAKFGYGHDKEDIVEHRGNGRFLVHDPAAGETKVLLKGLQFANGVALGPDDAYVLVNETGAYRILRYWLKGPAAGTSDVFADNLPGFPDNITFNGKDRFWVALYAPRTPILDVLSNWPYARKMVMRALAVVPPPVKAQGFAIAFDANGKLVANLQDDGKDAYSPITSVREGTDGYLYFGSLTADSLARMKMPPLPAGAH